LQVLKNYCLSQSSPSKKTVNLRRQFVFYSGLQHRCNIYSNNKLWGNPVSCWYRLITLMTLEEVAKYLKMQPQTIYTWAQTGKIPAAKIGKEWRFRKDIIDEWFQQHIDEKFKPLINQMNKKNKL
jgi:excisionase family DNA binding protein